MDSFEIDKKKDVLIQQTDAMSRSSSIHEQKHTPEMIVRTYIWTKNCILLIDEAYVKPVLSYHRGKLFGHWVSDNTQLVKTVLAFMIVCLYGGPKFWVKMLPISKSDTDFLYNQSKLLIDQTETVEVI